MIQRLLLRLAMLGAMIHAHCLDTIARSTLVLRRIHRLSESGRPGKHPRRARVRRHSDLNKTDRRNAECGNESANPTRKHDWPSLPASPPVCYVGSRWNSRCSTGSTRNVSSVEDRMPPITTVASGRCTSAPVALAAPARRRSISSRSATRGARSPASSTSRCAGTSSPDALRAAAVEACVTEGTGSLGGR
jgi:hypothetical protein